MRKEWCETEDTLVPRTSEKNPKKYRCPKCKKRFDVKARLEWDGVKVWLPKHKKKNNARSSSK